MFVGSFFIEKKIYNDNSSTIYSVGDILSSFLSLTIGVYFFSVVFPHIKSINEGKIAGKMVYDIINREPKIKINSKDGIYLN